MEITKVVLVLVYVTTSASCTPLHNPEVKEVIHEADTSEKESLRTVRNPKDTYTPLNATPSWYTYLQGSQQDYLKQRYAQQQRSDVARIAQSVQHKRRQQRNAEMEIKKEESKIDRQDLHGHVFYVDPKLLRQILDLKAKKTHQIQSRSYENVDTSTLNELIGKNPRVQLESLQRILGRNQHTFLPVFESKDHTPVTERTVDIPNPQNKPNIQVQSQASVQNPHHNQAVSKETFDRLQKQLEEASKYQVNDALEKAQKAAQAHVAAQHKAIEQAQRIILENVQKSLYNNPQALALVQPKLVQSTAVPPKLSNYKTALTTAVPDTVETVQSVANDALKFIKITPVPKHTVQKSPDHLHRTVTRLQAEEQLLRQIHRQNSDSNKALAGYVGEKRLRQEKEERRRDEEAQSTSNFVLHHHDKEEEDETDEVSIARKKRNANDEYDEFYEYYDEVSNEVIKTVKINDTNIEKRFYSVQKPWPRPVNFDGGCKPVVVVNNNEAPVYSKKRRRRRRRRRPHRRNAQHSHGNPYPSFEQIEYKIDRIVAKLSAKFD